MAIITTKKNYSAKYFMGYNEPLKLLVCSFENLFSYEIFAGF